MSAEEADRVCHDAIARNDDGTPKERLKEYYYRDDCARRREMWVSHTPGTDIPVRVKVVTRPGVFRGDYDSFLKMNIGSERDAWKLYRALHAFFNDDRTPPYWATGDRR